MKTILVNDVPTVPMPPVNSSDWNYTTPDQYEAVRKASCKQPMPVFKTKRGKKK